jgi:hypothetical protein
MRSLAVRMTLLFAVASGAIPVPVFCADDTFLSKGLLQAPQAIAEAWLRFHETDLCRELDAVFVFNKKGMEVWCRFENERNFEKLQDLLNPLRNSYQIDVYATQSEEDKDSRNGWNPPASLWENYELRSYLGDPFARAREHLSMDTSDNSNNMDIPFPDEVLKQRLLAYAEQIIKWNLQMKRYAAYLPALTLLALDANATPGLKTRARAIGRRHSQELEKDLERLMKSLKHAFPRYKEKERASSQSEKSRNETKTPLDKAVQIALEAQKLSWRIRLFIYPRHFAIDLGELRQPGLLEAINNLEGMASDYQKALSRSMHK